jgi:hypothetical protein
MSDVTFRDFAGALMGGDVPAAAGVLQTLLGLEREPAETAARHFQAQMQSEGQAFMMKAMGLRTAVTSGRDEETRPLLIDCFGLSGETLDAALAGLRARYGS